MNERSQNTWMGWIPLVTRLPQQVLFWGSLAVLPIGIVLIVIAFYPTDKPFDVTLRANGKAAILFPERTPSDFTFVAQGLMGATLPRCEITFGEKVLRELTFSPLSGGAVTMSDIALLRLIFVAEEDGPDSALHLRINPSAASSQLLLESKTIRGGYGARRPRPSVQLTGRYQQFRPSEIFIDGDLSLRGPWFITHASATSATTLEFESARGHILAIYATAAHPQDEQGLGRLRVVTISLPGEERSRFDLTLTSQRAPWHLAFNGAGSSYDTLEVSFGTVGSNELGSELAHEALRVNRLELNDATGTVRVDAAVTDLTGSFVLDKAHLAVAVPIELGGSGYAIQARGSARRISHDGVVKEPSVWGRMTQATNAIVTGSIGGLVLFLGGLVQILSAFRRRE